MLFDHFNAPAIFQRYINKKLIEKLNIFIIIYLYNIQIYIKDLGKPCVKALC